MAKYSQTKTWKQARPNEKIINCPTDDPILKLVGQILTVAYEDEGRNYFEEECVVHNNHYCGSYWTDIAGLDIGYMKKKAYQVYSQFGRKKKRKNIQARVF